MFQRAPAYLRGREKASSLLVPFYTFEGLQAISLAPPGSPDEARYLPRPGPARAEYRFALPIAGTTPPGPPVIPSIMHGERAAPSSEGRNTNAAGGNFTYSASE